MSHLNEDQKRTSDISLGIPQLKPKVSKPVNKPAKKMRLGAEDAMVIDTRDKVNGVFLRNFPYVRLVDSRTIKRLVSVLPLRGGVPAITSTSRCIASSPTASLIMSTLVSDGHCRRP